MLEHTVTLEDRDKMINEAWTNEEASLFDIGLRMTLGWDDQFLQTQINSWKLKGERLSWRVLKSRVKGFRKKDTEIVVHLKRLGIMDKKKIPNMTMP